MKLSYRWLQQYIKLELSPSALAEALISLGLEVEAVEPLGTDLKGVVIGHVLAVRPHPNANRLTCCEVDLGNGILVPIVCGAPNVAAGQKVAVALPGTTLLLPNREGHRQPVTIRSTKIRGELSEGMICAEDELGLSDDHSGILVLPDHAPTGQPFATYLQQQGLTVPDYRLELSLTPNRADATSHIGVARDLSALFDHPLHRPEIALPEPGGEAARQVQVTIDAPDACPRYVALLVRNVRIGPSPLWLRQRLAAIGLRSINNVVDVTNYVLHECGQPLHAFDFDRLVGGCIHVRRAHAGEQFITLDGKTRQLPEGALLICDAERPVALAGIMGGENSEVTEKTQHILIESAYFDPKTIRRTSKALGLQTDSSYRFERGVDAGLQRWAAARAAQFIAEVAGGEIVPGVVDVQLQRFEPATVTLRLPRLAQLLGIELPADAVKRILDRLGFDPKPEGSTLRCTVPLYRTDVTEEIDLVEEVARVYGYDRLPMPDVFTVPARVPDELPAQTLRRRMRTLLAGFGLREIYTNSLLPREVIRRFAPTSRLDHQTDTSNLVETLNPISAEMAVLRPSLLPGLVQTVVHNQNRGQQVLRFFEFGRVFARTDHSGTLVPGFAEHEALIIGLSGPHLPKGWDVAPRLVDFFDLKGLIETLLDTLHLSDRVALVPTESPATTAAYQVNLVANGRVLGLLARLSEELQKTYELRTPLYYAELNWDAFTEIAYPIQQRRYQPFSRFPEVDRDLAVLVNREQPVGPLLQTIREVGGAWLRQVSIFDLYEGERLPPDQKSVAFSLRFGADRTLTDEEVDACIEAIVHHLAHRFDAQLRR